MDREARLDGPGTAFGPCEDLCRDRSRAFPGRRVRRICGAQLAPRANSVQLQLFRWSSDRLRSRRALVTVLALGGKLPSEPRVHCTCGATRQSKNASMTG